MHHQVQVHQFQQNQTSPINLSSPATSTSEVANSPPSSDSSTPPPPLMTVKSEGEQSPKSSEQNTSGVSTELTTDITNQQAVFDGGDFSQAHGIHPGIHSFAIQQVPSHEQFSENNFQQTQQAFTWNAAYGNPYYPQHTFNIVDSF